MSSGTITQLSIFAGSEVDVYTDVLPSVDDVVTVANTGTAYDGHDYIVIVVGATSFRIDVAPDCAISAVALSGDWQISAGQYACLCAPADCTCLCEPADCICLCESADCTCLCGGVDTTAGLIAALCAQLHALAGCECSCLTAAQVTAILDEIRAACSDVSIGNCYKGVFSKVSNYQVNNINLHIDDLLAVLIKCGSQALIPYCGKIDDVDTERKLHDLRNLFRFMQRYVRVVNDINALDRNTIVYAQEKNSDEQAGVAIRIAEMSKTCAGNCNCNCSFSCSCSSGCATRGCGDGGHHGNSCGGSGCPPGNLSWHDRREQRRKRSVLCKRQERLQDQDARLTIVASVADTIHGALEHVEEVYNTIYSLFCTAIACAQYDGCGKIVINATFIAFRNDVKQYLLDLDNFIRLQTHDGIPLNQGACPKQFRYQSACLCSCVTDADIARLALVQSNVDALGALLSSGAAQLRSNMLSALSMLETTL